MSYTPLSPEQIEQTWAFVHTRLEQGDEFTAALRAEVSRAIETAATAPLLARIAELEKAQQEKALEYVSLFGQCTEALAEVDRLKAALAEASKDAQRLTWLDEQNADLGNEAWCVLGHDCTADEDFRKFWVGSDLRGAIDKAMKGTP